MYSRLSTEDIPAKIREINDRFFTDERYKDYFGKELLRRARDIFITSDGHFYVIVEDIDPFSVNIGLLSTDGEANQNSIFELAEIVRDILRYPEVKRYVLFMDKGNTKLRKAFNYLYSQLQGHSGALRVVVADDNYHYLIEKLKVYKNILTIDIDFLFKKMNQYQKFIDFDLTPKQSWKVIHWKTKDMNIEPDYESYEFVKKLLREKCSKAEVQCVSEHHHILNILQKYNVYLGDMVNVDYHHDINYSNVLGEATESNWVTHARNNNYIRNYAWIRQDDSELPLYSNISLSHDSFKDFPIFELDDFDLVVICTSKRYVPPEYWTITQEFANMIGGKDGN